MRFRSVAAAAAISQAAILFGAAVHHGQTVSHFSISHTHAPLGTLGRIRAGLSSEKATLATEGSCVPCFGSRGAHARGGARAERPFRWVAVRSLEVNQISYAVFLESTFIWRLMRSTHTSQKSTAIWPHCSISGITRSWLYPQVCACLEARSRGPNQAHHCVRLQAVHGGGLECSGGLKRFQANQFNVAGPLPRAPTMEAAQIKFISWEATKHIQSTGQRRSKQPSSLAAALSPLLPLFGSPSLPQSIRDSH